MHSMEERFQDDRHSIKIRLTLMTENTACGFSLLHRIRAGLDQSHALRTYSRARRGCETRP
ncbi:hypothetical protein NSND_50432 [Nitrospira sp. ND1]|nr:hypothetical protein NSND_50432 [Nitrospira sp. ND1]